MFEEFPIFPLKRKIAAAIGLIFDLKSMAFYLKNQLETILKRM